MKPAFIDSMRRLYSPPHVSAAGVNKVQWRDLIRTFSMAWVSALESVNADELVEKWVDEFKATADLNWWPDDSWKWW